eukprot:5734386-Prymnesium_polylepis.3
MADGPDVQWRCYTGVDRLGQSLWRKTAALLGHLATVFAHRQFYIKVSRDRTLYPVLACCSSRPPLCVRPPLRADGLRRHGKPICDLSVHAGPHVGGARGCCC